MGWLRGAGIAALALALVAAPAEAVYEIRDAPDPEHSSFDEVVEYYESGRFDRDAKQVGEAARRALVREFERNRSSDRDPAIVLDIDDTALSNYECQRRQGDFGNTQLVGCVVGAGADTAAGGRGLPRIEPVYRVFRKARRLGVSVFFITGRPQSAEFSSRQNLAARGYDGDWELTTYPGAAPAVGFSLIPYKSRQRARIQRRGYRILVNIGDQRSDLQGGYAKRKFLVPNPMYFTP